MRIYDNHTPEGRYCGRRQQDDSIQDDTQGFWGDLLDLYDDYAGLGSEHFTPEEFAHVEPEDYPWVDYARYVTRDGM